MRTTTILEAMKLAMLDSGPNSDSTERKKSLRSEKLSMEMQVQAMQLEDEENTRQAKANAAAPSSMKDIHLPPAPSLELTTVQLLAKSMPPNFCAGCQRTFCNNSNRDRHLKVCPFLLQVSYRVKSFKLLCFSILFNIPCSYYGQVFDTEFTPRHPQLILIMFSRLLEMVYPSYGKNLNTATIP